MVFVHRCCLRYSVMPPQPHTTCSYCIAGLNVPNRQTQPLGFGGNKLKLVPKMFKQQQTSREEAGEVNRYLYLSRFTVLPSISLASKSKMEVAFLTRSSNSSCSDRMVAPVDSRAVSHMCLVSLLAAARHTPTGA